MRIPFWVACDDVASPRVVLFSYALKSLRARIRANTLTILAIALLVVGGSLGLSLYASLASSIIESAPPENVIVLQDSATDESDSILELDVVEKVAVTPGVKQVSREFVSTIYVTTTDTSHDDAPTVVRGVDDVALGVDRVKVIAGALPEPKSLQVMIGRRLARQFPELKIGDEIPLPAGPSRISGVFEAHGSTYEDEVWMWRPAMELNRRARTVSTVILVADNAAAAAATAQQLNATKGLGVHAQPLGDYRRGNAGIHTIVRVVLIMLVLLSFVVTFAVAMTMNAAVSVRIPELAVLATIGHRKAVLVRTIIFESMLLGLLGALLGLAVSELVRQQLGIVSLGKLPVELGFSPMVLLIGFALGLAVGVVGAITPALTVRRLSIMEALR